MSIQQNVHRVKRFLGLDGFAWIAVGIMILSGLVYLPAMKGLPIWDDVGIIGGQTIGGGRSLVSAFTSPFNLRYYRPLVSASFTLDRLIFGSQPFFYHQTNIIIHILTVGAIIGLVKLAGGSKPFALLAGLLFALQPIQMAAVAWIGGRTDSLSALFVTLMMVGLVIGTRHQQRWGWAFAWVAFLAALLAKEQCAVLFFLVPASLVALSPKDLRPTRSQIIKQSSAFLVPLAILGLLTFIVSGKALSETRHVMGPSGPLMLGLTSYHYALLVVFPTIKQLFTYSLANYQSAQAVVGWICLILAAVATWRIWRINPFVGWALLGSWLVFAPISNIAPIPSLLVAPYRIGVSGIGIAVATAFLFAELVKRYRIASAPIALAVMYLGWLVFTGSARYDGQEAFFSTVISADPGSAVCAVNLFQCRADRGAYKLAAEGIESLMNRVFGKESWKTLDPKNPCFQPSKGLAWRVRDSQGGTPSVEWMVADLICCYGLSRENLSEDATAYKAYQCASEICNTSSRAYAGLGALTIRSNHEKGRSLLLEAIRLDPNASSAMAVLAADYAKTSDWSSAAKWSLAAAKIQPWVGPNHVEAARALIHMGRMQDAREQLDATKDAIVDKTQVDALRKLLKP